MPFGSVVGAAPTTVSNAGPTIAKPAAKKPTVKKPAPKKKTPTKKKSSKPKSATAKYLAGDTTYQQQVSDFNRSKADYESNYKRQSGIVNRDYAESQRALNRQGVKDREDQQNDFAGRGILHSGVFAKALGDYNTEFNTRLKALTTGKSDKLGDLSSQRTSFLRQLQIESNNARQDAIRRRAANLGI